MRLQHTKHLQKALCQKLLLLHYTKYNRPVTYLQYNNTYNIYRKCYTRSYYCCSSTVVPHYLYMFLLIFLIISGVGSNLMHSPACLTPSPHINSLVRQIRHPLLICFYVNHREDPFTVSIGNRNTK